jgi:predicted transcriptional regulator
MMATLTIELSEEQQRRLLDRAREAGTTPEQLIRAGIDEWLSRPRGDFTDAAEYVLEKNAELYRRLA